MQWHTSGLCKFQQQYQYGKVQLESNVYKSILTKLLQKLQSALVIRTTFVPLCFSRRNVLITSSTYECSYRYNQRNYLVFWKSVRITHVLITRFLYDVLISRVLISRVDCNFFYSHTSLWSLLLRFTTVDSCLQSHHFGTMQILKKW